MSGLGRAREYLRKTQDTMSDERREHVAKVVAPRITATSDDAEVWRWVSLEIFGEFPGGAGAATDEKVTAVTEKLLREEAARWGVDPDHLSPQQRLEIAFAVRDKARVDGWKPKLKPSHEDKLNAVSDADLAARYPAVGDARDFAKMTATERLKWTAEYVRERDAADAEKRRADERAEAVADETLSPEQRLARHWG